MTTKNKSYSLIKLYCEWDNCCSNKTIYFIEFPNTCAKIMIYGSIFLALNIILMVSITKCQRCVERFDLIIVVDSSGSIRDNNPEDKSYDNWQLIKDFLSDTADLLEISEVNEICFINSNLQTGHHLIEYR